MAEVTFKKICLSCKTWDRIPNMIFWMKEEELYEGNDFKKLISLAMMNQLLEEWHVESRHKCERCESFDSFRFNEVKINGVLVRESDHMRSSFTLLGLKEMGGQITLPPTGENHTPNEINIGLRTIKHELDTNWSKRKMDSKSTGFFEFKIEFDRRSEKSSLVRNHIDGLSYHEITYFFEQVQEYYRRSLAQHRQEWTGQTNDDLPF